MKNKLNMRSENAGEEIGERSLASGRRTEDAYVARRRGAYLKPKAGRFEARRAGNAIVPVDIRLSAVKGWRYCLVWLVYSFIFLKVNFGKL